MEKLHHLAFVIVLFLCQRHRDVGVAAQGCPLQGNYELISGVTLNHVVDLSLQTISVEVVYDGLAWVSFGRSDYGGMAGSQVVIAMTDEPLSASNPGKYS